MREGVGRREVVSPDPVGDPRVGDSSIPNERSQLFLDAGRPVELDAGSHWVMQEEPEKIGALLVDFFRER